MSVPAPHFLLFSNSAARKRGNEWRFVLKSLDSDAQLEAFDIEPDLHGERLELLAVVRGLEALDQPSDVTLVTPSRYVSRGIAEGLEQWRSNDWQWESYGEMVPIKNRDLWQRVDRALAFHRVDVRARRFDAAEQDDALPAATTADLSNEVAPVRRPERVSTPRRSSLKRLTLAALHGLQQRLDGWYLRAAQCGTALLPRPWLE